MSSGGGVTAAREADLLDPGAALPVTDGGVDLALEPWEIRTLQIRR